MATKLDILSKLADALNEEALSKADFVASFEAAIKMILDALGKVNNKVDTKLTEAIQSFSTDIQELRKSADSDYVELKAEMVAKFNAMFKDQENSLNFLRDKVRGIRDGKPGPKGDPGSPDTPEQVVDKVNRARTKVSKNAVEGLTDLERKVDTMPRGTVGGAKGVGLYVDGAKKKLTAQTLDFVAGSNVTITHSTASGVDKITFNATGGSGSPGGSDTQVQYNNAGAFGGITGATTNGTTLTLVAPVLGAATATSIQFTDTKLERAAANILAQRNSTNAQTFRVYGTYTDESNGDWFSVSKVAGGTTTITNGANGTGVSGAMTITATSVAIQHASVARINTQSAGITFACSTSTSAATHKFGFTGASDTNLTASTEAIAVNFNLSQTRQHATGALTLQRDFVIQGSTHSFVGASTITNAAALAVTYGNTGTNATATNLSAIYVATAALSANVTNGYGINIAAPSGATNNFAARFAGATITTGSTTAHSGTAIPAGGTTGAGMLISSTANYGVFFGSGAPTLSAAKGSLYLRSDGSTTNDRMYVNTDGGTTWTAVTTVA